jgi:hypothetical protein
MAFFGRERRLRAEASGQIGFIEQAALLDDEQYF